MIHILGRRKVCLTMKISGQNVCYIPARSFIAVGYEWQIDYNPNGYHPKQRWVKLRLTLVRGPSSPAMASFTFRFVDPNRTPDDPLPVVTEHSTFRQGVQTEVPLAPISALETSGYLGHDGNCIVRCEVVVFHKPDTAPEDPFHDLGNLLSRQNGADVTLVVGAESFRAHRDVLAARSPVFAAEFAGSLLDETHEVKDMDADTFRALLHFIYTAALPPQLEQMDRRGETGKQDQEGVSMARRLLDAADQYGVERLKMMCEEKVCASVSVGTAATDLVLAERRGYKKLKATCMEFLVAHPAKMLAVARAGGYRLLETSCPSVLTEIITSLSARSCHRGGAPR